MSIQADLKTTAGLLKYLRWEVERVAKARDVLILRAIGSGMRPASVARIAGVSRARVCQIQDQLERERKA